MLKVFCAVFCEHLYYKGIDSLVKIDSLADEKSLDLSEGGNILLGHKSKKILFNLKRVFNENKYSYTTT